MSTLCMTLHEDAFYEYFKPFRHPKSNCKIWGGHGLETFGADFELVRSLPVEYVWTVIDGDSKDQWISPGILHVNRVCHLVTKISHNWLNIDFRVSHVPSSLTKIGLSRQINKIKKLTEFAN
jgi:hypothetical protein